VEKNQFGEYSVKGQGEEIEIRLYNEIGENLPGGISADLVAKEIKALGGVNKINIRINSPGGEVFEGMTIYNLLKEHRAKKIVWIDGLAAGIASIIAMAGDEVYIKSDAMMMIREASMVTLESAPDPQGAMATIKKINNSLAKIYMVRSSFTEEEIMELMKNETWMHADFAITHGFADHKY